MGVVMKLGNLANISIPSIVGSVNWRMDLFSWFSLDSLGFWFRRGL